MTQSTSSTPMSRQPASRMLDLGTGLRYHILEWDAASEHTVVLVHGFLDLSWGWHPVVEAGLVGRFHIVAPDMRGHGDSDRAGAGGYYHFMDYLADLHALIEQVGRTRVSLVGHSMGGSICSYYAGTFTDQVTRLALLEGLGPPEPEPKMPRRLRGWIESWKRIRTTRSRTYASVDEAASRLRAHDPLLSAELARFLAEKGTVGAEDGGRRFKHDPLHMTRGPYPYQVALAAELWRNIACPVLLVDGSESTFHQQGDETAQRYSHFKSPRRVTLQGAAHMMQRHRPAELARLLADFLADEE